MLKRSNAESFWVHIAWPSACLKRKSSVAPISSGAADNERAEAARGCVVDAGAAEAEAEAPAAGTRRVAASRAENGNVNVPWQIRVRPRLSRADCSVHIQITSSGDQSGHYAGQSVGTRKQALPFQRSKERQAPARAKRTRRLLVHAVCAAIDQRGAQTTRLVLDAIRAVSRACPPMQPGGGHNPSMPAAACLASLVTTGTLERGDDCLVPLHRQHAKERRQRPKNKFVCSVSVLCMRA